MKEKLTIILFSGEMDKALAAFTLATAAAAGGMEVTIFFTFWGLNLLKKKRLAINKTQNIFQRLFNVFSTSKLPVSKLNMFGLGSGIMRRIMKKSGMASLNELMNLAGELKVKYVACSTSCGVLGLKETDLIDSVAEFAGAAYYISEAKNSKINLFI